MGLTFRAAAKEHNLFLQELGEEKFWKWILASGKKKKKRKKENQLYPGAFKNLLLVDLSGKEI